MKKALLSAFVVMVAMSFAVAQNYIPTTDVLGAHQNGGRGCAGCHTPHSGARGSGQATSDLTSGNAALWGQDVSVLYGKTIKSGNVDATGGYVTTFSAATTWADPEGAGLLMCLSCHDGNSTPTNMMTNQSYEQRLNLLPAAYGTAPIPTLLGNDGSVNGNYNNDHPVGKSAVVDTVGDWPASYGLTWGSKPGRGGVGFATTATVVANSPYDNFLAVYGDAALLAMQTDGAGNYYPVCTTCHNQHSMNVFNTDGHGTSLIAGGHGTFRTFFFVKGPYNPAVTAAALGTNANSTTQFCRQCHFGDSNEANGAIRNTIPTVF